MRARAELATEIKRQCADVGALGAADAEVDLRALPGDEFELREGDRARLADDFDALAREVIELLSTNLLRRMHRWNLELVAQHGGEDGAYLGFSDLGDGVRLQCLTFGVLGVGHNPERRFAKVFFVLGHQLVRGLGGLADQHDEQAGGHRVERAGMADATRAVESTHAVHDVVRGDALRLVDEQHARGFSGRLTHFAEYSR